MSDPVAAQLVSHETTGFLALAPVPRWSSMSQFDARSPGDTFSCPIDETVWIRSATARAKALIEDRKWKRLHSETFCMAPNEALYRDNPELFYREEVYVVSPWSSR